MSVVLADEDPIPTTAIILRTEDALGIARTLWLERELTEEQRAALLRALMAELDQQGQPGINPGSQ